MIKVFLNKIFHRYGVWKLINTLLIAFNLFLLGIIIFEIFIPFRPVFKTSGISSNIHFESTGCLSDILKAKPIAVEELIEVLRPNLFKASTSPQNKPMADETIEKIKSKLKLQCVLNMSGELIAYVRIQDSGLKKCKVGDSISDLFTVLNISQDSMEILIIGHKVTLSL